MSSNAAAAILYCVATLPRGDMFIVISLLSTLPRPCYLPQRISNAMRQCTNRRCAAPVLFGERANVHSGAHTATAQQGSGGIGAGGNARIALATDHCAVTLRLGIALSGKRCNSPLRGNIATHLGLASANAHCKASAQCGCLWPLGKRAMRTCRCGTMCSVPRRERRRAAQPSLNGGKRQWATRHTQR